MSPEHAIHEAWSGSAALTAIVPSDRFVTGWQEPDEEFVPDVIPYAALEHDGEEEVETTSSGTRLASATLRLSAWARDLAQLKELRRLVEGTFFNFRAAWDGGAVLNMTAMSVSETRLPRGMWRLTLEFATRTRQVLQPI